jgi:hypothetical protein
VVVINTSSKRGSKPVGAEILDISKAFDRAKNATITPASCFVQIFEATETYSNVVCSGSKGKDDSEVATWELLVCFLFKNCLSAVRRFSKKRLQKPGIKSSIVCASAQDSN